MKTRFILLLCTVVSICTAQKEMQLSLPEVIALAQSDAPDVLLAQTRLSNNYWVYQSALADFKPQINLNIDVPDINRTIDAITLPDGTQSFISRAFMTNGLGVSVSQDIPLTGGSVFARTGLERLDIFKTDLVNASNSYFATPISVGFTQPIFGFNALKWQQKIEPLRYQEATLSYAEEMESIAYNSAELFFNVLIAQLNIDANALLKSNADTLYNISKGRFEVGRIAETELLQIELAAQNASASLAEATLNLQSSTEQLRNFLGITEAVNFELLVPENIPDVEIDGTTALRQAFANRSQSIRLQRQLREADREVDRAVKETGINGTVFGQFGLSQTAETLSEAYGNPLDQERISVGIQVPIADWGKAKARREIAQSNQQLTQMNAEQERVNFEREILLRVQQFDLVRNQIKLAERAFEIAKKSQEITRQRYLIGKIGILDLNVAIRAQDDARVGYINALRRFWLAYYELRNLCLYDFENEVPLVKKPEGF